MSYTNQEDYNAPTDAIRSNVQGKAGGQSGSDVIGRKTTDPTNSGAANDVYGADELSDPSYSNNGNRYTDNQGGDVNRQRGDQIRGGDPDQLSDPTYSQNADRFDNSSGAATGGTHFGASGDPNTFSTTGNTGAYSPGNKQQPQPQSSSDSYGRTGSGTSGTGRDATSIGGTQSNDDISTARSGNYNTSELAGDPQADQGGYGKTTSDRSEKTAYNESDDVDVGGNVIAGAGTGTGIADQRPGENAYGNYFSDVGRDAPPAGLRGGANDPGYQPGQRYNYGQGGYVEDGSTTTQNLPASGGPSMGDKIKGTLEKVQGKLTKNPDLIRQGEARKAGNLHNDDNFSSGDNQYGSSGNTDDYDSSNVGAGNRNQYDTTTRQGGATDY